MRRGLRACPTCGTAVNGNCCGNVFADMMLLDGIFRGDVGEIVAADVLRSGGSVAEAFLIEEIIDGDF